MSKKAKLSRFQQYMERVDRSPPPHKDYKAIIALNGWYWEPYGSVIQVIVECRNLARIHRGDTTMHKTISELRGYISKMGYEKVED